MVRKVEKVPERPVVLSICLQIVRLARDKPTYAVVDECIGDLALIDERPGLSSEKPVFPS